LTEWKAQNLILRTADPSDRRQIRISLTEALRELSDEYNKVSHTMNEIYYARFSDDEIVASENTLRRILFNLNEKERMI
jgi:DNA-binding MarR family transcriptional regulator